MKTDNRNAFIDLIKIILILIVFGSSLGALYEASWKIEHKIIVFSFIFLLGLIANEVSGVFNSNKAGLDALMLIFIQLELIAKKQGVKGEAGKIKEELETGIKGKMEMERKYFDFEFLIIVLAIGTVIGSAIITTILIN
tara:strand:- start:555 stop:971 length:417 start_codon:yes stop_codon:yes gene_type:complete